ncbi:MAG TPA: hypothetical protein PLU43_08200 [Lachnospiraceae bacterium]|nr:hypothetical protein [Lachnospiraceae bacterium]
MIAGQEFSPACSCDMIMEEKAGKRMNAGIIELDLHGLRCEEAKKKIDSTLNLSKGVYIIRLIHGYHGGTGIKRMVLEEYNYGREERVLRVCEGSNPGITELVLREY